MRHGYTNYNLRAYKAGKATQGFPQWPYKHIHACETTILHTIQSNVDLLEVALKDQAQVLSSDDESLDPNNEFIDVPNSSSASSSSD